MPRELNFSFSGLKTAVRYALPKVANLDAELSNLCASFQQAVIDVLVDKSLRASIKTGAKLITLSGGVSCNSALRTALQQACESHGLQFLACPIRFSTDNAAMIAFAGMLKFRQGFRSDFTEDIDPNLVLCEHHP
jgi:N6-L-threonylcarbamoyladenine synthase